MSEFIGPPIPDVDQYIRSQILGELQRQYPEVPVSVPEPMNGRIEFSADTLDRLRESLERVRLTELDQMARYIARRAMEHPDRFSVMRDENGRLLGFMTSDPEIVPQSVPAPTVIPRQATAEFNGQTFPCEVRIEHVPARPVVRALPFQESAHDHVDGIRKYHQQTDEADGKARMRQKIWDEGRRRKWGQEKTLKFIKALNLE